jgi:pilus assembly protein Flp/PilA
MTDWGEGPVWRNIRKFHADERGATSIEYGLIVAIVGLSLVVALASFPGSLNGIFSNVAAKFE